MIKTEKELDAGLGGFGKENQGAVSDMPPVSNDSRHTG